jgi:hypothetical protein
MLRCRRRLLARLRHAGGRLACLPDGEGRKLPADSQNDAIDRAPQGRELSVSEGGSHAANCRLARKLTGGTAG